MGYRRLTPVLCALWCGFAGCTFLGLKRPADDGVVDVSTAPQASPELVDRLDTIGQALLDSSPLGIPAIDLFAVGSQHEELFHPSPHQLFVSEGILKSVENDDELAAVLALEIAAMTLEYRGAVKASQVVPVAVGQTSDATPLGSVGALTLEDRRAIAGSLLQQAGYKGSALAEAEKRMARLQSGALAKQLGGMPQAPVWSK
jgi:hypothetical protein